MKTYTHKNHRGAGPAKRIASQWFMLPLFLLLSAFAIAALPPAGATIGNQAVAEYTDSTGERRTVTSNEVETVIAAVAGVDIDPTGTLTAAPDTTVNHPFTVTNTGNDDNDYDLATAQSTADDYDCAAPSPQIYFDLDRDGTPDDLTNPITNTGTIQPGEELNFILSCTVPSATAVNSGDQADVDITATSTNTAIPTATDVITRSTIVDDQSITVTKIVSPDQGAQGTSPVVVRLTYTNTGTVPTDIEIIDVLPQNQGGVANRTMTYVPDSGLLNGVTPLTDVTTDADGYDVVNNTVTYSINNVGVGVQGFITFEVSIDSDAPAGSIVNIADFSDGNGGSTGRTNEGVFEVVDSTLLDFRDPLATDPTSLDGQVDGNPGDDIYTVPSAPQGSSVDFYNVLVNNGNSTDTFDITLSGSSFPSGTGLQLLSYDPATDSIGPALVDSDAPGDPGFNVVDSGPLAPGETFVVLLRALLPPNAPAGGPYSVVKTATSTNNPAISDSVTDTLTEIIADTVDLTNRVARGATGCTSAADSCGFGVGPETTAQTTVSTTPGNAAVFSLFVNNTSAAGDQFDLFASSSSTDETAGLPNGWTVNFYVDSNGVDDGQPGMVGDTFSQSNAVNTGNIPAGEFRLVFAEVIVPEVGTTGGLANETAPNTYPVYFSIISPVTGTEDVKFDAVDLEVERSVTITPNHSGVISPGTCVIYEHTVTNAGNFAEGDGADSTLSFNVSNTDTVNFEPSILYWDSNGSLELEETVDTVIPNGPFDFAGAGIPVGGTRTLFLKSCAKPGVNNGVQDVAEIRVTTTNVTGGFYDTNGSTAPPDSIASDTTVVDGAAVKLEKRQLVDENCDGTEFADNSLFNLGDQNVLPGQCLCYLITADNQNAAPATDLQIRDVTPAFTTYNTCSGSCAAFVSQGTAVPPAANQTGPVIGDIGNVPGNGTANMKFCVRVNTN